MPIDFDLDLFTRRQVNIVYTDSGLGIYGEPLTDPGYEHAFRLMEKKHSSVEFTFF